VNPKESFARMPHQDAKVRRCCIACLSLGSPFLLTSFVSFAPQGE
jgi:hypothetical protein